MIGIFSGFLWELIIKLSDSCIKSMEQFKMFL
jgi:hypothetical protein